MVLPMQSFTPEDMLLYLYKETSPELTAAIEEALKKDWTLREKFDVSAHAHRLPLRQEDPHAERFHSFGKRDLRKLERSSNEFVVAIDQERRAEQHSQSA